MLYSDQICCAISTNSMSHPDIMNSMSPPNATNSTSHGNMHTSCRIETRCSVRERSRTQWVVQISRTERVMQRWSRAQYPLSENQMCRACKRSRTKESFKYHELNESSKHHELNDSCKSHPLNERIFYSISILPIFWYAARGDRPRTQCVIQNIMNSVSHRNITNSMIRLNLTCWLWGSRTQWPL